MNFQDTRDKLFRPLLELATRHRLTPNMVSIAGVISMILFGITTYAHLYIVSLIFLVLSILADLLDGSLARFQHNESDSGRKIDIITDTISFDVFLLALGFSHLLGFSVVVVVIILHIILTVKNTKKAFTHALDTGTRMYTVHGFWIVPNTVKALMYASFVVGIFLNNDTVPIMRLLAILILAFGIIKR